MKTIVTQQSTVKANLKSARGRAPESIALNQGDQAAVIRQLREAASIRAEENESLFYRSGVLIEIEGDRPVPVNTGHKIRSWCESNDVRCHEMLMDKDGKVKKDDGGNPVIIDGKLPSQALGSTLISRADPWRELLYPVDSVTAVSFFRADGSVITKRGYYEDLRLYNVADLGLSLTNFETTRPTQRQAAGALSIIREEVFADFPFASPSDRANAIGAPLALLTRYIHGNVLPLFGITANESGAGKGYLSQTIRAIITPDDSGTTGMPAKDDEKLKVIGSLLSGSQPVISWDNVPRGSQITSPVLCQLHTSAKMQIRTLGQSKIPVGINDRLWLADGNGISPGEDMVRRYVQIALLSKTKDPALQHKEWRHEDLIGWVNDQRSMIVGNYLIMYKAWVDAGCPKPQHAPKVSTYQAMIDVVAGVLEFAGEVNFWGNVHTVRNDALAGSDEEANFNFLAWIEGNPNINERQFSSADVMQAVKDAEGLFNVSEMDTPLPHSVAAKWHLGAGARSQELTRFFKGIENQRFGNEELYRVVKLERHTNNKTWFELIRENTTDKPELDELERLVS